MLMYFSNLHSHNRSDFTFLITFGLMMGLMMTPHNPANIGKRMMMLLGFAFTTGRFQLPQSWIFISEIEGLTKFPNCVT